MNNLYITLKSEIENLRMLQKVRYDNDSLNEKNVNYKEFQIYERALDDVLNLLKKYMGTK